MISELTKTNCYYPLQAGIYFIVDDNLKNKPLFVDESEIWTLKLVNESQDIVNFFQNDGCLMKENHLKKCDWICIKNDEIFFIEAKNVKMKKRNPERIDAVEKFDATLLYFIDLYPMIKTMKVIVIVNFRSPRITNASNKSKEAYFNEKYNAKYKETNFLKFV